MVYTLKVLLQVSTTCETKDSLRNYWLGPHVSRASPGSSPGESSPGESSPGESSPGESNADSQQANF